MRKGECLISADVQADGGARNQPTEEEIDVVQDQETTGAASEDRPDEQGEDVVQQPEGMTKTTPKAKKPGRRK
jgi:hypothetical protein